MSNEPKLPVTAQISASAKLEAKTEIPSEVWPRTFDQLLDLISPITESMGLAGDTIRNKRLRLSIQRVKEVRQLVEESGLPLKAIPHSFSVHLIEQSSLVEDADLSAMWTKLLASAATDPEKAHPSYIKILSQLNATDALALICDRTKIDTMLADFVDLNRRPDAFFGNGKQVQKVDDMNTGNRLLFFAGSTPIPATRGLGSSIRTLQILARHGLIRIVTDFTTSSTDREMYVVSASITPLGVDFVEACQGPMPRTGAQSS